ncbi:MAG: Gfo/Idh/MocA family protein [Tepidisphaerales bacterium]
MRITRRGFLAGSVAAAVASKVQFARGKVIGANDRIGVGFIAAGGRAGSHMSSLNWLKNQGKEPIEFVAVAEAYRPRLNHGVDVLGGKAKAYMDYRQLIDDPAVDLICIATPDHHHAPQAIAALKAGKHVYVEKPVTHWRQFDLLKELAHTAEKSSALLQCGTQGMSCTAWRQARQLIADGLIGQPIHAEAGYFRVGDWGERGMPVDDKNAKPGPDLDWDAFLGDSPRRPFSVDRFFRWRLFEDYAGGPVTDLYPHSFTPVVYMLGVKWPSSVVASGGIYRYPYELRDVPDTFNLLIDYPEKITVCLMGTQGNNHFGSGPGPSGSVGRSPLIRGWEGSITFTPKEITFAPVEGSKKKAQTFPIEKGEDQVAFWKDFLDRVRAGKGPTLSPMDTAYYTQTALIMGMQAYKQQKTVKFDPAREAMLL